MRLSLKPARSCTLFNPSSQMQSRCCTLTQPASLKTNLDMYTQAPKYGESAAFAPLLLDSVGNSRSSSVSISTSAWSVPVTPVPIGARWMDYQGIKNWEGMLDPLDSDLRSEIIRYGHFVEAAYRSCDFEPSSSSYAKCRYSKRKLLISSGFSDTGYRVTKNLNATSGIQLPQWTKKAPSWMATQSSWIGYVAVCQDERVISRLGRRDVVIAFRGTVTCLEWLENLRATLTPFPSGRSDLPSNDFSSPMVESGFLSLYTSRMAGTTSSLQDLVRQEIARILEMYGDEPLSFTITGHSLGAALATLTAYDIKETFKRAPMVTVISFGGPRVGNQSFRHHLEEQGTKILRIVNSDDLITKVPGFVVDNNEGVTKTNDPHMANLSNWIQKCVEDTQWVYADVGCELRLSSRDCPHLNSTNIATCHELKTYLHLVDGFVSSNCPFRATARKMMNKSVASTVKHDNHFPFTN